MSEMKDVTKISYFDDDKKLVADIAFRKGTADERSIRSVMEHTQYDIALLNRRGELLEFYRRTLASGHTPLIVDLGANIGASALFFDHVWPGSRIIAVEPSPDNFALLAENTKTRPNIRAIHAGIASTDGFLHIQDNNAETDAYRTTLGAGDIRAISMATLLRQQDGEPFICKIDIEGAEQELFSKNEEWIDRFPLIMIELHDWMLCGEAASQTFLQAVSRRRRDFLFYGETAFSIRC